jgi:hypothetical protein
MVRAAGCRGADVAGAGLGCSSVSIDQPRPRRRTLPEAEQGLIGSLLIRPAMLGEVSTQVVPEDFLRPHLRNVYVAMLALWGRGIHPTMESVADELSSAGLLDAVGGNPELVSIVASTSSPVPAHYVPVILEASLRRRAALRCQQAQEAIADPRLSAVDAVEAARELLATIDVPTDAPSEAVDLPTFVAGDDSYDWLVPDLIERGDRLLIVAAEGVGKTMLARQLAVCCSVGIHPFSGRSFNAVKVLMVDLENPVALARRKLRPMHAKARQLRPQADHSRMSVVCRPGGLDVTNRADARWLTAQLTHERPDLVVLGPLYKLFSADDNWERGARTVTTILDDLRQRLNFGLVMETHAPGGSSDKRHLRPVGSSLWLRWPEFILTFTPTPEDPNVVAVTLSKGRDERYWPTHMRRGGDWPWTPCADPGGPKGRAAPPPPMTDPRPEFEQAEAF